MVDIATQYQENIPLVSEPFAPPVAQFSHGSHTLFPEMNVGDLQSGQYIANNMPSPPESVGYSWPTLLDIHYQGLDDVPSSPDPGTADAADGYAAWQKFMEEFSYEISQ
jgi:hypothetical protein